MRRLSIAVTLIAVALVAAACSSAAGPAWTYAPPTPAPSAVASAGASGAPSAGGSSAPSAGASAGASSAPSAGASAAPSAGASGAAGGAPVVITALNLQFTTPEVSAPASVPFVIDFQNGDAGQPHNVVIKDSTGTAKFTGTIVTGVTETKYDVPALDPGTYEFICSVHQNMKGTLKVGA